MATTRTRLPKVKPPADPEVVAAETKEIKAPPGTWNDGETVYRTEGGHGVPEDKAAPAAVPLLAGDLATFWLNVRATDPDWWPKLIDAEVLRYRKRTDGVTWPALEGYRKRLTAYCDLVRAAT